MRRRRAIIRIHLLSAAAALIAALCVGCASVSSQDSSSSSAVGHSSSSDTTAHQGGGSAMPAIGGQCPETATDPAIVKLRAQPPQVPLPRDFHPVAAVRCMSQSRMVPGDGEWEFADAQRADSGLAGLLTALALPSQKPPTGTEIACAAVGMLLPPFALVDAHGAIVDPVLPHDFCGTPLKQVLDAMDAVPWRIETEQKISQLQTQPEVDSGCPSAYKDVFEIPVYSTPTPWSEVRAPAVSGPLKACVYTVPSGGTPITDTRFSKGATLDSTQEAAVTRALADIDGTTPAPACSTTATRFAEFTGLGLDGAVVELDGCHRIQWPNGFRQTASAPLLRALAGAGLSAS